MRTALVARLALVLAVGCASASAGDPVQLRSPLPFDHSAHAATFERTGVSCLDCHPIGARRSSPDGGSMALPEAPRSSCHGCHLGEVSKVPRSAPDTCTLCHASLDGLKPRDHGLDWISAHGDQSRSAGASCSTCHRPSECLDCHDRRGAGSENPHPAGFRSGHGVEARLDPRSCSTCHTEQTCTSCHLQGAMPW